MDIRSEITKALSEVEQICSGESYLEPLDVTESIAKMRDLFSKLSKTMQSRDKQPYRIPGNPKAGEAAKLADEMAMAIRANDCQGALRIAEELRILSKEQHWL